MMMVMTLDDHHIMIAMEAVNWTHFAHLGACAAEMIAIVFLDYERISRRQGGDCNRSSGQRRKSISKLHGSLLLVITDVSKTTRGECVPL